MRWPRRAVGLSRQPGRTRWRRPPWCRRGAALAVLAFTRGHRQRQRTCAAGLAPAEWTLPSPFPGLSDRSPGRSILPRQVQCPKRCQTHGPRGARPSTSDGVRSSASRWAAHIAAGLAWVARTRRIAPWVTRGPGHDSSRAAGRRPVPTAGPCDEHISAHRGTSGIHPGATVPCQPGMVPKRHPGRAIHGRRARRTKTGLPSALPYQCYTCVSRRWQHARGQPRAPHSPQTPRLTKPPTGPCRRASTGPQQTHSRPRGSWWNRERRLDGGARHRARQRR